MEWWLIRHGRTLWNEQHRYQGHSDIELLMDENLDECSMQLCEGQIGGRTGKLFDQRSNELHGEASDGCFDNQISNQQSNRSSDRSDLSMLRDKLRGVHFQEIYCSDLLRCRQTLDYAVPNLKPERVKYDYRLREMNFGAWEGQTYDALKDDSLYRSWIDHPKKYSPPGGETWEQFYGRVYEMYIELLQRSQQLLANERLILGTHNNEHNTENSQYNIHSNTFSNTSMIRNTGMSSSENINSIYNSNTSNASNVTTSSSDIGSISNTTSVTSNITNTHITSTSTTTTNSSTNNGISPSTTNRSRNIILSSKSAGTVLAGADINNATELHDRADDMKLLIVTHGGVISLLSTFIHEGSSFWDTRVPPGGIMKIQIPRL